MSIPSYDFNKLIKCKGKVVKDVIDQDDGLVLIFEDDTKIHIGAAPVGWDNSYIYISECTL